MSKNLFVLKDGTTIAAYKEQAWHKDGHVEGEAMTSLRAWAASGMDRVQVVEEPLFTESGIIASHKVVRMKDNEGNVYKPFVVGANRPAFDFQMLLAAIETAVHATGGTVESLFRLREGALIGATIRLPEEIKIGGDIYLPYVNIVDSIDASSPLRIFGSDIRQVCDNTVKFAESRRLLSNSMSVRHTKNAVASVTPEAIRNAVDIEIEGRADMASLWDELLSDEFTKTEFGRYTDAMFGTPDETAKTTRSQTIYDTRTTTLNGLFVADTQASTYRDGKPTKATALQSVIEYIDHKRPVKGGNADEIRFAGNMDGTSAVLKGKALALIGV